MDRLEKYGAGYWEDRGIRLGRALERSRLARACAKIDTLQRRVARAYEQGRQEGYEEGYEQGWADAERFVQ